MWFSREQSEREGMLGKQRDVRSLGLALEIRGLSTPWFDPLFGTSQGPEQLLLNVKLTEDACLKATLS